MKNSHKAMLGGLAAVFVIMLALAAGIRTVVTNVTSGDVGNDSTFEALDLDLSDDLVDFDRLRLRGAWDIEVEQGDGWDVQVSVPDKTRPNLQVGVADGVLVLDIGRSAGLGWFGRMQDKNHARITLPRLSGIQIEGTANVELGTIDGDSLEIEIAGAGNVTAAAGRYNNLDLTISGAGNAELERLAVTNAHVNLSGATNVELTLAGGDLTGQISGVGHVGYGGEVERESIVKSGFASIERRP